MKLTPTLLRQYNVKCYLEKRGRIWGRKGCGILMCFSFILAEIDSLSTLGVPLGPQRSPRASTNPPIYLVSCCVSFTSSFLSPIEGQRNICYIYCHGAVALTFALRSIGCRQSKSWKSRWFSCFCSSEVSRFACCHVCKIAVWCAGFVSNCGFWLYCSRDEAMHAENASCNVMFVNSIQIMQWLRRVR